MGISIIGKFDFFLFLLGGAITTLGAGLFLLFG